MNSWKNIQHTQEGYIIMRTEALKSAQARYKSRFKTLQIAVTPEQYEQLQNMAAAAHLSRTQFLLRAAEYYYQHITDQAQQ